MRLVIVSVALHGTDASVEVKRDTESLLQVRPSKARALEEGPLASDGESITDLAAVDVAATEVIDAAPKRREVDVLGVLPEHVDRIGPDTAARRLREFLVQTGSNSRRLASRHERIDRP